MNDALEKIRICWANRKMVVSIIVSYYYTVLYFTKLKSRKSPKKEKIKKIKKRKSLRNI